MNVNLFKTFSYLKNCEIDIVYNFIVYNKTVTLLMVY